MVRFILCIFKKRGSRNRWVNWVLASMKSSAEFWSLLVVQGYSDNLVVQGYLQLHRELEISMGSRRPCLKRVSKKEVGWGSESRTQIGKVVNTEWEYLLWETEKGWGIGDMTQSIQCLLPKNEYLASESQNPSAGKETDNP